MRKAVLLVVASAMAFATSAAAQTSVSSDVVTDTVWGGGANPSPIILEQPIFVANGATLTILPGTIVRGQPRTAAVQPGIITGTPGAVIVTQTGRINAVGSATNPIIFTTAAIDNNNDNRADTSGGFLAPWSPGDTFLDEAPLTTPLSPLNRDGIGQVTMWGGVVILGNAPTNLANAFGVGQGKGLIEGLTVPGFPGVFATYGGADPHDSSGVLQYVSIRHAGDELGNGNELNCLSMGGVGDGTTLSFVECAYNFDDGFEWFGGTVDGDHLMSTWIGDDSFDLDQGYTGVNQFLFAVMPTFNQNNGTAYGSSSGDKACEFDGDDFAERGGDINVRADGTPWPLSSAQVYNLTVIGGAPDGSNPAVSDKITSGRAIDLRNGFAGRIYNSFVVNTGNADGVQVRNSDGSIPAFQAETNATNGLIAVVSSTFNDVAALTGPTNTALANGDAIGPDFGATSGNVVNGSQTLVSENTALTPTGVGTSGKLGASLLPTPINPEPNFSFGGIAGGVNPFAPGTDAGATYRGAFERLQPNWTTGWTVLNISGLLVD